MKSLIIQMVSAQDLYPPEGGRQFDPAPRYESYLRVAFRVFNVHSYVLYSQKYNHIYIGGTFGLANRFISHNEKALKGTPLNIACK